jgi:integration host factor subunit beta
MIVLAPAVTGRTSFLWSETKNRLGGEVESMTKSDLVGKIMEANGVLTRKESELVVNLVFDSMCAALTKGEKDEIRGFGSFTIREREAREARNPKSGAVVKIAAKKTPFFKTGKELRERVNNI